MFRPTRAAFVGALLCGLAGCLSGPLRPSAAKAPPPQTAKASVAVAAGALQEALAQEGIATVEKHQGQVVLLVGATQAHEAFALRLAPLKGTSRGRTAVAAQWGAEPDQQVEQTVQRVLAAFEAAREENPPEKATPQTDPPGSNP